MHKRALIALDEPAICLLIEKALHAVGMEALTIHTRADAEGLLDANHFELVFLDYHAGTREEADLVRRLRSLPFHRTTPIVLISDDKNPHALARGFEAGASFFLFKPIENRSVLQLIRATQGAIENERRRMRRVPVRLKAVLRNDRRELQGETIDVSMNGFLVQTPSAFPIGSSVEISLYLSASDAPISCSGCVVRHAARNRMGIQFGRFAPSESEKLQESLLSLTPEA